MFFSADYRIIPAILSLLLLTSCKAAKPELTSLLGRPGGPSGPAGPTNTGAGQFSLGGSVTKVAGNFRINAHVSQTPTQHHADTPDFKVRARVKF